MNKSESQYISLNDPAPEMFGKIMAMPDSAIVLLLTFATELPNSEIDKAEKRLDGSDNPKNLKEELAFELVRMYHGEKEAEKAKQEFNRVFSEKQLPGEIEEFKMGRGVMVLTDLLKKSGLASSASEAKRLIDQKAVRVNNQVISNWSHEVKKGDIVKVGPRKFVRTI